MKKYLCIKSTFSEKQGAVYEIGKKDMKRIKARADKYEYNSE
ncbi:hypothetical protein [Macrococcoides caseolyticum]|nr:hypothetical protein [Macrococcus caseolyticus]